jgi:hypothetical protein
MKKRFTLILASISCLWLVSKAQSGTTTQDSLAGFDSDPKVKAITWSDDPAEKSRQFCYAQRDYIDRKYQLGRYSPGFVGYPGKVYGNPTFPVSACSNADFETGDFTGWAGTIGDNDIIGQGNSGPLDNQTPGIFTSGPDSPITDGNSRHTIISNNYGNDPYGGFPGVPAGAGNYTVRLGGQTPNYQGETLEQTFTVSSQSTSFAYRYAAVLNDPQSGHNYVDKPYFKIEVLDANGNPISPCTQLFVVADASTIQGFIQSTVIPPTGGVVYYRPWTVVNFDLTAFINQSITIRFTVAGCTQGGHFGYAYVDCSCSALSAHVNFCPGNTTLFLSAPDGYSGYQWIDPNGNPIPNSNNDTLIVTNPTVGDTFYVYLTSSVDTSCHTTLPVVLEYTVINASAQATAESCYGYDDGTLMASGSLGIPPYTYTWNTSPPQTGAMLTGIPPGTYIVHMTDSLGCENYDTAVVIPALRLDTSLFNYTFCPGDPHITLNAPMGYQSYTWIGPNGDTLPTGSPAYTQYIVGPQTGQEYTCILINPPACPIYDSIVLNLNPPTFFFSPDSMVNVFTPNGDLQNDYFYPYFDHTVSQQTANPSHAQPAYDFFQLYVGTYEIWVYNRWGQEVFYSNDYNIGWDGKINGKDASEGVYYYITKFTTRCVENQEPIEKTGFVHLVR